VESLDVSVLIVTCTLGRSGLFWDAWFWLTRKLRYISHNGVGRIEKNLSRVSEPEGRHIKHWSNLLARKNILNTEKSTVIRDASNFICPYIPHYIVDNVKVEIGLNWLRIGSNGGPLFPRYWTFGFLTNREFLHRLSIQFFNQTPAFWSFICKSVVFLRFRGTPACLNAVRKL
jgi:hypothetical protein